MLENLAIRCISAAKPRTTTTSKEGEEVQYYATCAQCGNAVAAAARDIQAFSVTFRVSRTRSFKVKANSSVAV